MFRLKNIYILHKNNVDFLNLLKINIMEVITFNELRHIKDMLPDGSMEVIASELNISADTVRNAFGGANYQEGTSVGFHLEQGPDGGLVHLDNPEILAKAKAIIDKGTTS